MRIVVLVLASIFAHTAYPEPSDSECDVKSEFARDVVQARYRGVPLRRVMETAPDEFGREIATTGYDLPEMSSERDQQRQVNAFGNTIYLECVEAEQEGN